MDVSLHTFSPKLEKEIPADYVFSPFSIFTEVFPPSLSTIPPFFIRLFLKGRVEKYKENKIQRK